MQLELRHVQTDRRWATDSIYLLRPFSIETKINQIHSPGTEFKMAIITTTVQQTAGTSPTPGCSQAIDSPQLEHIAADDPATTHARVVELVRRDGGVVITGLIDPEHVSRIRDELQPAFEADVPDASGFFPTTTRRATGLLGISDGCVDLATNKLWIDVANEMLTSECRPWYGEKRAHFVSKPILAGTFGFQIAPGSRQQDLHRDDR